jgi:hypothetical protein
VTVRIKAGPESVQDTVATASRPYDTDLTVSEAYFDYISFFLEDKGL